jgi:UDP-glucose 4-epimerase
MGNEIKILARNTLKIPELAELPGVQLLKGEIHEANKISAYLKGTDACIHIALHWGDSAVEMLRKDTHSSVQLFELAARSGVKKIIYTSSTAVNDWLYMDESSRAGGDKNTVSEESKPQPVTFYGASKGAAELYLNAIAFQYKIKHNIIRPGYTFGNPVVRGSNIQADQRFANLVHKALKGEDIELIKNDGTQFIWAGDLAKIYLAILDSGQSGKTYFGLGNKFITWEAIALKAISMVRSTSKIKIKDLGWPDRPALFQVAAIKRDFGFSFPSWDRIVEHLNYYISIAK